MESIQFLVGWAEETLLSPSSTALEKKLADAILNTLDSHSTDELNPVDRQEYERTHLILASSIYAKTIASYLLNPDRSDTGITSLQDIPLEQVSKECIEASEAFLKVFSSR